MREDLMCRYTTLGVGGAARVLIAEKQEDLSGGVILGGGSNVLIGEKNLPDFIINKTSGSVFSGDGVYAPSGEKMRRLCALSTLKGLGGLEWAWGLPGSLGGAIKGNAGALGGSIGDLVEKVLVQRGSKKLWLDKTECAFGYRRSGLTDSDVILAATLRLEKRGFADIESNLLAAKRARRNQPKGKSAGCIFKNPPSGSIGKMLDELGLKGKRSGGAIISPVHANFIINQGNATPYDVYSLIVTAEEAIEKAFGFKPEREIKIYGDF